jgi:hypothetical protein
VIVDIVPDHNAALDFYNQDNMAVSQNIIGKSTSPFPLDYTHGISAHNNSDTDALRVIEKWNADYMFRAKQYPKVAITRVWNGILYLDNPPIINHQMMKSIFGRIPGTQNPPKLSDGEWQNFKTVMNL